MRNDRIKKLKYFYKIMSHYLIIFKILIFFKNIIFIPLHPSLSLSTSTFDCHIAGFLLPRLPEGHPTAMLTVIRFIPSKKAADLQTLEDVTDDFDGILTAITEYENQKSLDDEFIENFRIKTSGDENILYSENSTE